MPTQHLQTFSLSDLSLAEEIIDTDYGTADVGGDTGHTPCAVDETATNAATPPAGDNAARNLSIDFAYTLSLGYHKEEYYLLILADGVEMLGCAPTNLDRDLHTFGSYCIGHLTRESKLVENTTLDDRDFEGAFLMSDHSTPTFWMWSFKFNKPMKMCDGNFDPAYPFRDPSVLQHPGDLSHGDICAMHAADCGFDQDNVSIPHYDLRSHAALVHDAPSHAASIERRQQVDASDVRGDENAPQEQTHARTHHSPQLAAAASPASATQIYAAPSVLTRKDYRGWTLGMHLPAHAKLELLSDIQPGRALVHHQ